MAVLNPNDGFLYIKMNGPAGPAVSQWDWKLPSQSYGLFPGPWTSIGVYYIDQSGSNRSADINIYDSDQKLYLPSIIAIGRAVALAGSALDISQGTIPANPPASTVRLWVDGSGNLHKVDSVGADETILDNNSVLGGELHGTFGAAIINNGAITSAKINPNPLDLRPQAFSAGNILSSGIISASQAGSNIGSPGDLNASRAANVGYLWFGDNGQHYLGFDGTTYQMITSGLNVGGGITGFSFNVSGGAGYGSALLDGRLNLQSTANYMMADGGSNWLVRATYGYFIQNSAGSTIIFCNPSTLSTQHYGNNILSGTGNWATVGGTNNNGLSFYSAGGSGGPTGWQVISTEKYKSNSIVIDNALMIVLDPSLHGMYYSKTITKELVGGEDAVDSEPFSEYGFIAEPWSLVAPDVVSMNNGIVHMMDYGQINAILFEAFKQYVAQTDARLNILETSLPL